VIAADGGARQALEAGVRPDLVVGDGDSLSPDAMARLRAAGVPMELVSPDKDQSDTELCLRAALERGARDVTIVGALGGPRPEHAIANVLLLAHPMLDDAEVILVSGASSIRRIGTATGPGAIDLAGAPGDHVSLLPVDAVEGVVTHGLRFPLRDEPLVLGPTRGLSNELVALMGRVETRRGRLLVIHTPRTEPAP
jgi:thiamine pyrophosphokinase